MLDYLRIHSVIKAVLDSVDAKTAHACLFFSTAGAAILQKFYRKNATPIVGAAFYLLDSKNNKILSFANLANEEINSSDKAFHAWVKCEDYFIDFMAPMFPEICLSTDHPFTAPSCMFQKKWEDMIPSIDHFDNLGDFFMIPNADLTIELQKSFIELPANIDLVNICLNWYRRHPKKMPSQFHMQNDLGEITTIKLKNSSASVIL